MRIKDWKKFQHFKDRLPPWIKLYRELLDDPDWHELEPKYCKTLMMLWLLASEDKEKKGNLPSPRKIAFRLRMNDDKLSKHLQALKHWLTLDDNNTISEGYQDDAPETETETETENNKKKFGEYKHVLLKEKEKEKLISKFGEHGFNEWVIKMDEGIEMKGYKYKSHYLAILNWAKKDGADNPLPIKKIKKATKTCDKCAKKCTAYGTSMHDDCELFV